MPSPNHLIDQAVFTSAETERSAGYQLVALSPGISGPDARALSAWGPSHDSLIDFSSEAVSYNFHPLPSGCYCISRTTPAGWEYSGRGGRRVYTQCLVVPPAVLERFANNPFALLKAAKAAGALVVHSHVPAVLDRIALPGRAGAVDENLVARLAIHPGPRQFALLLQAARDVECLAFWGEPSPEELISGVLSCLPPAVRTRFSFTTGLKFSSRRPFRLVALSEDRSEQRWVSHHANVTVLNLGDEPPVSRPLDGWSLFIERALACEQWAFLASRWVRRFDVALEDLPALGLQWLEELEAAALKLHASPDADALDGEETSSPGGRNLRHPACDAPAAGPPPADAASELGELHDAATSRDASPPGPRRPARLGRSDGAHPILPLAGEVTRGAAVAGSAPASGAAALAADAAEVTEALERLDDLVFAALEGHTAALEELRRVWPELRAKWGDGALAESREQYLRRALQIWQSRVSRDGVRNPMAVAQALDVVSLLFGDV